MKNVGNESLYQKRIDTMRRLSIGKYPFPVNLYSECTASSVTVEIINNKFLIQFRIRGIDNSSFKQLIAIYCLL